MPFLAPALPFIAGIGIGLQALGSISAAKALKKSGREAQILANERADLLVSETNFNQISLRRQISSLIGRTVTAFAGGGVVASTGSAADVRFDNAVFGDKVALFDRYVGLKEAAIVRKGGDFAAAQGRRAARGTLLAGLGSAFSSVVSGVESGVFG